MQNKLLQELDPYENVKMVRKASEKRFAKEKASIEIHAPASDEDSSIPDDVSQNSDPVFDDEGDADSSMSEAELLPSRPRLEVSPVIAVPETSLTYPRAASFATDGFIPTSITSGPTGDEFPKDSEAGPRHRRTKEVQSSYGHPSTNSGKLSLPFFGHHLRIPSPLKLVRKKSSGDNSPPNEEIKEPGSKTTEEVAIVKAVAEDDEEHLLRTSDGSRRFSLFSRGKHGK